MSATPRQNFIRALERKPMTGRVPHFELVFFLTMEAFGRVHNIHRNYAQWGQMSEAERKLHLRDLADLHVRTAETFEHSAIFVHPQSWDDAVAFEIIDNIRELAGDRYFLMLHGDATFGIPDGNHMMDFALRIADDPAGLHAEAERNINGMIARAEIRAWRLNAPAKTASVVL